MTGLIWLAVAGAAAAQTPEVDDCSRVEADGTRSLCQEIVLPAPRAEVWALFASTEGLASWVAPVIAIDLSIGGLWEASYDPAAQLGDAANIHNRVISYLPERMLSVRIERAPPGFPHLEDAVRTWSVVEFEEVDALRTRVRVWGLGYGHGPGFDALYGHFEQGNLWTLQRLFRRVREGPLDWDVALPTARAGSEQ
jgi:uncharacterized protein YndB with AHSA1/START domain